MLIGANADSSAHPRRMRFGMTWWGRSEWRLGIQGVPGVKPGATRGAGRFEPRLVMRGTPAQKRRQDAGATKRARHAALLWDLARQTSIMKLRASGGFGGEGFVAHVAFGDVDAG